tara:strand:+ start:91186 stop:92727 length:1542 start_codon:yes stop_codon:yes gene_type:complete
MLLGSGNSSLNKIIETPKKGLLASTVQGSKAMVVAKICEMVMGFASMVVLARLLMPVDYGIFGLANIVVGFFLILSKWGIQQAVVQSRDEISLQALRALNSIAWLVALSSIFFIWILATHLQAFFEVEQLGQALLALSSLLILGTLELLPRAMFMRAHRFNYLALCGVVSSTAGILVSISLAFIGLNYWALVLGSISATFVGSMMVVVKYPAVVMPSLKIHHAKNVLRRSSLFNFIQLFNFFNLHLIEVVIAGALGASELGIFNRTMKLISYPLNLFAAVRPVLFSTFSRIQEEDQRARSGFYKVQSVVSLFGALSAGWLVLNGNLLVSVVLGPRWSAVGELIEVVAVIIIVRLFGRVAGTLLSSKANFRAGVYSQLLLLLSTLTLLAMAFYYDQVNLVVVAKIAIVVALINTVFLTTYVCVVSQISIVNLSESSLYGLRALLIIIVAWGLGVLAADWYAVSTFVELAIHILFPPIGMMFVFLLKPDWVLPDFKNLWLDAILKKRADTDQSFK